MLCEYFALRGRSSLRPTGPLRCAAAGAGASLVDTHPVRPPRMMTTMSLRRALARASDEADDALPPRAWGAGTRSIIFRTYGHSHGLTARHPLGETQRGRRRHRRQEPDLSDRVDRDLMLCWFV